MKILKKFKNFFISKGSEKQVIAQQKIRVRLLIAIPTLTSLLVLGLGWIIIETITRNIPESVNKTVTTDRIFSIIDTLRLEIGLFGILAFFSGIILAIAITLPIHVIIATSNRIAKGDFSKIININTKDEMSLLGEAFNKMLVSLNKYFLQGIKGGILTIDKNEIITSVSSDAELIIGISGSDIVGRRLDEVFPEELGENKKLISLVKKTLNKEKTISFENLTISTEERENMPISISTSILKDEENELIGIIITFEEIEHLKLIQSQIKKIDKLTMIGSLSAGIAHQIRNPLGSIKGLSQLMIENPSIPQKFRTYAKVIINDVERIENVINKLLNLLRPTSQQKRYENINLIVKDALLLAKNEIKGIKCTIEEVYNNDIPLVWVYPENLIQAFMNLIINAIQALKDEGVIVIKTDLMSENGYKKVIVSIEDNGVGIPEEILDKIFEPIFSTKENGAGLGLSITKQIIEDHDGEISVWSREGKGSKFTVSIPIKSP